MEKEKLNHGKQDEKYFKKLREIKPDFIGDNPETMKVGTICPLEIKPLDEVLKGMDIDGFVGKAVKSSIKNFKEDLKEVWCDGFISLSEECFEREWNKSALKHLGEGFLPK